MKKQGNLIVPDHLQVIEGGKEPALSPAGKGPTNDNWLNKLSVGSSFLARPRQWNAPEVMQYSIMDKSNKATQLTVHLSEKDLVTWVDTQWFSGVYELFEELPEDK